MDKISDKDLKFSFKIEVFVSLDKTKQKWKNINIKKTTP